MRARGRLAIAGVVVAGAVAVAAGVAMGSSGGDAESPITGDALTEASAAACSPAPVAGA